MILILNHVRAATSSGLNLTDFSGNGIFIQNGGNVGIGVSNPRNIIDINGIGGLILDYFQSDIDQTQNCSGCTGHVALETSGTNPLNWETIYSTSNPSFQDGTKQVKCYSYCSFKWKNNNRGKEHSYKPIIVVTVGHQIYGRNHR